MKTIFSVSITTAAIAFLSTVWAVNLQDEDKNQDEKKPTAKVETKKKADESESTLESQFAPIDNMHHFMEYISLPSYQALKEAMAGEAPKERKAWKPIKSHALILAETSALVAQRMPEGLDEKQTREWKQISLNVYNSGRLLYKSAGKFEEAKKHYGAMIESCNQCHKVFDNGKHQLEK